MTNATDFTKMVPGFDFLQGLMKTAGAGLPNMGQWIAPTLNPDELEKRIEELRTVQFWLEQNAKLLGTTIQALEVQRMTLSTLRTMNLPLTDLRQALTLPTEGLMRTAATSAPAASPPAPAPAAAAKRKPVRRHAAAAETARSAGAAAIDPMQWWGALTQQFSQLAANALKDTGSDAARRMAGAVVKQSIDSAGQTIKKAADVATAPVKVAARAAGAAAGVAASAATRSKRRTR